MSSGVCPPASGVDNGVPWGNGGDLPPPLALWWVGLGIGIIWNHPHRPTENAKVERANGTVNRWGEPERCADFPAWKAKLQWASQVQRGKRTQRWGAEPLDGLPGAGGPGATLHGGTGGEAVGLDAGGPLSGGGVVGPAGVDEPADSAGTDRRIGEGKRSRAYRSGCGSMRPPGEWVIRRGAMAASWFGTERTRSLPNGSAG